MKNLTYLSIFALLLATMSFKGVDEKAKSAAGVYGVNDVEIAVLQLSLFEDFTFEYIDHSDAEHPIDVSGTWSIEKDMISLEGTDAKSSFHHKWKLDGDCPCIKSRKGLSFYRLCSISN